MLEILNWENISILGIRNYIHNYDIYISDRCDSH